MLKLYLYGYLNQVQSSRRRKRPRPRTSPRDEYADRLAVAGLVGRTRILAGGDERYPSVHQTHDGLSSGTHMPPRQSTATSAFGTPQGEPYDRDDAKEI